jgi:DNA-binding GntR family transcriptional regulator
MNSFMISLSAFFRSLFQQWEIGILAGYNEKSSVTNTTAIIYQALLKKLVGKDLPPGRKINQQVLAKELNTSRTPIVKALHKLETQGLVEHNPNKGFYVHKLNVRELLDLWVLREALDTMIATELTDTLDGEQVRRLENIFKDFADGSKEVSPEAYRQADQEFHGLMFEFSENELAKRVNEYFQIFSRSTIAGLIREPRETLPEHMAIIQSLKNNDKKAARDAVVAHIDKTKVFLEEAVYRLRKLGIDPRTVTLDELSTKQTR